MERRPERQRLNTELPLNSPSEDRFCPRHTNSKEENKESKVSFLCHLDNQQKSTRNDPPRSDVVPSRVNHDALRVCEYVDCRDIVIRQMFVTDNLSCRPSSHIIRDTSSTVDNISVTNFAASTSLKEQYKICLPETDITDKNLVNEQTIKSEPCSYMPQMQQPSNNTSMLRNLPKTKSINMLPSNRTQLDKLNSDKLPSTNLNDTSNYDMNIKNVTEIHHENSNINKEWWMNNIYERLCPQNKSLVPSRNNESTILSDSQNSCSNTTNYSDHLNIFRIWPSVKNLASCKMSATTKSYLMLLVVLFITNMAGKKSKTLHYFKNIIDWEKYLTNTSKKNISLIKLSFLFKHISCLNTYINFWG